MIAAMIGSALWLVLALRAVLSREKFPKKGMRAAERDLLGGAFILAIAWLLQADFRTHATQASVVAATPRGTCASIEEGMRASEVKDRLGDPDEMRSAEETRGPGASILLYRGSRCAVHLFDERVEFVD